MNLGCKIGKNSNLVAHQQSMYISEHLYTKGIGNGRIATWEIMSEQSSNNVLIPWIICVYFLCPLFFSIYAVKLINSIRRQNREIGKIRAGSGVLTYREDLNLKSNKYKDEYLRRRCCALRNDQLPRWFWSACFNYKADTHKITMSSHFMHIC